jgi:excisionase family DNA binding protein
VTPPQGGQTPCGTFVSTGAIDSTATAGMNKIIITTRGTNFNAKMQRIIATRGNDATIRYVKDASDFIDSTEAGKILGVGRRQVLNLIASGVLPASRIGNSYIIRRSDLAKVPKSRKPGPKPKGK